MEAEGIDFYIYYASQTGTAENFAQIFKSEAKKNNLAAKVVDLAEITMEKFKQQKNCVFLMATHYEGDPPDNAASFWEWFTDEAKMGMSCLFGHQFTVFALGDTTYEETFARIGQ